MQQFCIGRKKQKAKLCRSKVRQAPRTVISSKMEKKPAKFTSLWFETLVECKASIARRKEEKAHISWEEKKAQYPLQNKNADFLDLSPAPQQVSAGSQQQAEPHSPRHSLCSGAGTSGPGLLCKTCSAGVSQSFLFGDLLWVQLCNWSKKTLVGRGLWEVYISLRVRMSMST